MSEKIEPLEYSPKYFDENYEYRQVTFDKELGSALKGLGTISEKDWGLIGISMSKGWVHYDCHPPEPHVLLFRRPLNSDPASGLLKQNGEVDKEKLIQARLRRFYESREIR